MKRAIKTTIVNIISYSFILLFLYAAANKLMELEKFKVTIGQSPLLTDYAATLAWLVPVIEIAIAGMLAFKRTLLPGLYASFSLMLMFSVYIFMIMNFAERIPCSCGGILEKMNWGQHLVFNLVFVGLGIVAILLETKLRRPPGVA